MMNKNEENEQMSKENTILTNLKQEDNKIEFEKNKYIQLSNIFSKIIPSFIQYDDRTYNSEFIDIFKFPITIPGENTPECFSVRFDKNDGYVAGGIISYIKSTRL